MPPVMSTQQPPVYVNYRSLRRFIAGSRLRSYLAQKKPNSNFRRKDTTNLHEVLQYLKEVIMEEKLYDDHNASIVLCDKALEDALNVRALHLTEIREQVCKQLIDLSAPSNNAGQGQAKPINGGQQPAVTPTTTTTMTIGAGVNGGGGVTNGMIQPGGQQLLPRPIPTHVPDGTNPAGPPRLSPAAVAFQTPTPLSASTVRALVAISQQAALTSAPRLLTSGLTPVQPANGVVSQPPPAVPAPALPGLNNATIITAQSKFLVKPAFREVLDLVPGVTKEQFVFTYEELTKHLSSYILQNKDLFFDERNIKVALCGLEDPLGKAFQVRAFHRSQVTSLLRSQLIPYVPPEEIKQEPPEDPDTSSQVVKLEIKQEALDGEDVKPDIKPQQLFIKQEIVAPAEQEEVPMQVVVKQEPNLGGQLNLELSERSVIPTPSAFSQAKETRTMKRSLTFDDDNMAPESSSSEELPLSFSAAKRTRHRSRSCYQIELVEVSDDVEGGDAYSSAGEETIYSEQGYETVAVCNITNDDDDDEDLDDFEADEFTEYEVDSDAYREDENNADLNSSSEDSDFQDVCIIASAVIMEEGGTEFDADSESDFELSNFDPEVGPRASEVWKCVNCNVPNTPYMRMCHKCWQERKGWVPSRPKPRRRRRTKNKRTEGQTVKGATASNRSGRPPLDRSISDPGRNEKSTTFPDADHRAVLSADDLHKDDFPVASGSGMGSSFKSAESVAMSSSSQDSGFSGSQATLSDEMSGSQATLSDEMSPVQDDVVSCSEDAHDEPVKKIVPRRAAAAAVNDDESEITCSDAEVVKDTVRDITDKAVKIDAEKMRGVELRLMERFATVATSKPDLMCNFCLSREKNAGIIHGGIIHQICCFPCAKRLYKKRQPCPMCRRRIEKISKIIVG